MLTYNLFLFYLFIFFLEEGVNEMEKSLPDGSLLYCTQRQPGLGQVEARS